MRDLIIDIDMDYFIHPRLLSPNNHGEKSVRYRQWVSMDEFLGYLETIGVLNSHRIHAATFNNHNDALYRWDKFIHKKQIMPPFDILHIDAHSDFYSSTRAVQNLGGVSLADLKEIAFSCAAPADFLIYVFHLGWLNNFYWLRPVPQKNEPDNNVISRFLKSENVKIFTQEDKIKLQPASLITIAKSEDWCPVSSFNEKDFPNHLRSYRCF